MIFVCHLWGQIATQHQVEDDDGNTAPDSYVHAYVKMMAGSVAFVCVREWGLDKPETIWRVECIGTGMYMTSKVSEDQLRKELKASQ